MLFYEKKKKRVKMWHKRDQRTYQNKYYKPTLEDTIAQEEDEDDCVVKYETPWPYEILLREEGWEKGYKEAYQDSLLEYQKDNCRLNDLGPFDQEMQRLIIRNSFQSKNDVIIILQKYFRLHVSHVEKVWGEYYLIFKDRRDGEECMKLRLQKLQRIVEEKAMGECKLSAK
jgi:hypothetical protein